MTKVQGPPKCLYGSTFCEFGIKSLSGGGKFVHDIYGNPKGAFKIKRAIGFQTKDSK
jgi:hypothetical protein